MPEGFYKALFGPICDVPREESILNRSREFLEEIGKRARDGCQRTQLRGTCTEGSSEVIAQHWLQSCSIEVPFQS